MYPAPGPGGLRGGHGGRGLRGVRGLEGVEGVEGSEGLEGVAGVAGRAEGSRRSASTRPDDALLARVVDDTGYELTGRAA